MKEVLEKRINKLIDEAHAALDQGQKVIFELHLLKMDIECAYDEKEKEGEHVKRV